MSKNVSINGTKVVVFESENEPVLNPGEIAIWRNTVNNNSYIIFRDSVSPYTVRIENAEQFDYQESVKAFQSNPPAYPKTGDRYLVKATGTKLWAGKNNYIAEWNGKDWDFTLPTKGCYLWIEDDEEAKVFNGTEWVTITSVTGLSSVESKITSAVTRANSQVAVLEDSISIVESICESKTLSSNSRISILESKVESAHP